MNYVTTNIRISEDDYIDLKHEAVRKRKSLGAIIREKLQVSTNTHSTDTTQILKETEKLAHQLGKRLKGFDSVRALREMRYEEK